MKVWQNLGAGILVFGVLLAVILIPKSLKTLEHDEFGVRYNGLTERADRTKVYKQGRYLLTPASKFFKYKRTLQTLDLSGVNEIECLTREGLNMKLDITTQYQIKEDNVFDIFDEYGEEANYVKYLNSITRDTIKDVCSNFTGEKYFFQRGVIELAIAKTLKGIYEIYKAYATSELVQLRNVMHPEPYEEANRQKQSVNQEKDRILSQRKELLTEANTELLLAKVNADIKLIQANAAANSIILEAQALAPAEQKKWQDRTDAFVTIKNRLGNTTIENYIEQYIKYFVLTKQDQPIFNI